MQSFKDTEGREWNIKISYHTIARVEEATGILITTLGSIATERQLDSPSKFLSVLEAVLRPQLKTRTVSAEELGEAMDQETVEAAYVALSQAVVDFFPKEEREVMSLAFRKLWTAKDRHQTHQVAQALQAVNAPEFETMTQEIFSKHAVTSGSLLTNFRESLESIPAPSPSVP